MAYDILEAKLLQAGTDIQNTIKQVLEYTEQQRLDPDQFKPLSMLPDIIQHYRHTHKMSKGDLALLAGVTANTLTKSVKETENLRVDTLQTILHALGLKLYVGPLNE